MNPSPTLSTLYEILEQETGLFIDQLIRICEVPAPPFQERQRAEFFAGLFRQMGFDPAMDEAGNVIISIFSQGRPHLVLSAHLDTVFALDQIHVKRDNHLLRAPGISDDSAGLAALWFLIHAFRKTGFPVSGSLTVLATVGEEGLGNLRGVRHFFSRQSSEVDYFISLDGSDAERLVICGLASKRVRVYFRGPGGHSWGDAGTVNPIHVCGQLLGAIHSLALPSIPKSVVNVGIIQGGTSINAIPTSVHLDIDLRSEEGAVLHQLDTFLQQTLQTIQKNHPDLRIEMELLGERPSGSISSDHRLVRHAVKANRMFGIEVKLDVGSTDSNVPLALGIPAITLGVGGVSGKIHTPEEWYDYTGVQQGLKRIAYLIARILASPLEDGHESH